MISDRELARVDKVVAKLEDETLAVQINVIQELADILAERLGGQEAAHFLRDLAKYVGAAGEQGPAANQSMHLDARGVVMTQDLLDYINQSGTHK